MNFQIILCPLDFSDSDGPVNQFASTLAHACSAEMIYLHVLGRDVPYTTQVFGDAASRREEAESQLQDKVPTMAGVRYRHLCVEGHPARSIIQVAGETGSDLIVMGTHGKSGWQRLVVGSVAEYVIRNATIPVLAVRGPTPPPDIHPASEPDTEGLIP